MESEAGTDDIFDNSNYQIDFEIVESNVNYLNKMAKKIQPTEREIDDVITSVATGKELPVTFLSLGFVPDSPEPWTVVEREKLLTGLRQYGPSDVSKLSKMVGTRSINEVLTFLKEMKRRSEMEIQEIQSGKAPIEQWLNIADLLLDDHPDYTTEIERVLIKFASKLRDDPMRNRFNYTTINGSLVDVEYSRILTHLSCLIKGCAVNQLTPMESFILIQLLTRTADYLKTLDLSGAQEHLRAIIEQFTSGKLPINHDNLSLKISTDKEDAISDKSFNPFKIPPEIIEPMPVFVSNGAD